VPDPRVTNPELFDLRKPDAPIPQFVNAMKMAGIEITAEQVAQGITYEALKDKDGNPFVVAVYNLGSSLFPEKYRSLAGPVPLMIAEKGEKGWGWRKISLKDLGAIVGIKMGTSIEAYPPNKRLFDLYSQEFDFVDIDYDLQWFNLEPEKGKITFAGIPGKYTNAQSSVEFALKNGQQIMGGPLLYVEGYPDWLKKGNFSRDQLIEIMKSHIISTVTHFRGQVNIWPVINELQPAAWGRQDILRDKIGSELVELAFQTAREADPSAILIYNGTNNHTPNAPDTEETKKIITILKRKNLVDGVGLHMHLNGAFPPSKELVIQTMRDYGVPIYITEFDVNMKDVPGTEMERLIIQAQIYYEMGRACLESGVCVAFNQFTPGDKYSWLERTKTKNSAPNADPTAFDDNLNPKLAYYTLAKAFLESFLK